MSKVCHLAIKKLAEKVVRDNVNSACLYINYQPELPRGAFKFKK